MAFGNTSGELELDAPVNSENTAPRTACVLLLDTSFSMTSDTANGETRLSQLNRGFKAFAAALDSDPMARRSVEVEVVTFGGMPTVEIPFTEGRDLLALNTPDFDADGATPLGAAIQLALESVDLRKKSYQAAGIEYYRPWIWILTDGAPTDGDVFTHAAARLKEAEAANHVAVFGVCIGDSDRTMLQSAMSRKVLGLPEESGAYVEMFEWLSRSISIASSQSRPGANDTEVAEHAATDQIELSPPTWGTL